MGKLQQGSAPLNIADEMRRFIASGEIGLSSISPDNVRQILSELEQANDLIAALSEAGTDVRPEAERLNSLEQRSIKQAAKIIKAFGGQQAYSAFRREYQPQTPEHRRGWWSLDQVVAAQRQRTLKQLGTIAAVLVVLAGLGYVFRDTLFPDDPIGRAVAAAERHVRDAQPEQANAVIQAGLTLSPTNPLLLIWQGALDTLSGNVSQAEAAFTQAKAQVTPQQFLYERTQIYIRMTLLDRALEDANKLIDIAPTMAEAYYQRATVHEYLRDRRKALEDLQKCEEIARASNNDVMVATVRVRMGMLLQSPP